MSHAEVESVGSTRDKLQTFEQGIERLDMVVLANR